MTLRPVIKPLLEADVYTSPQAWARKALKSKKPTMAPGFRNCLDHLLRRDHAIGTRRIQAKKKRINKKLAGEVSTSASFTMAKDVPQKMETPSKTISAAKREEEDTSFPGKGSPQVLQMELILSIARQANQSESINLLTDS